MSRPEALQVADQLVTQWTSQVKNERGYVHDKWQPVDVATRTTAVLRLAEFLLAGGPQTNEGMSRLASPEPPHLHRASCDGTVGELLCGYPPGPTI